MPSVIATLQATIAELRAVIVDLRAANARLEERVRVTVHGGQLGTRNW